MKTPTYRKLRNRPLRALRNAEIVIAYQAGKSTVEVGHAFGVTDETVRTILRQNRVKLRPRSELAPYRRFFTVVAYVARQQSRRKVTHGTAACYRAGCRCDDCRAAHTASCRQGQPYVRTPEQRARISAGKRGLLTREEASDANREYRRAYYAANREEKREYARAYYAANREKIRARQRVYEAAKAKRSAQDRDKKV